VLVARKDLPVANLQELIAYAQKNQASMQFGSAGTGSTGHIDCALLNAAIGINLPHIPYRGGGPAMQDLIAGRFDYFCTLAPTVMQQIEGNLVKPLAVLTRDRSPMLPNLASAHEQGLKDFDASTWFGFFLPPHTPPAIIAKLHDATVATMDTPSVEQRLRETGTAVVAPERRNICSASSRARSSATPARSRRRDSRSSDDGFLVGARHASPSIRLRSPQEGRRMRRPYGLRRGKRRLAWFPFLRRSIAAGASG
jgi:Tripartite tricarboxylate transporter family receptor